MLVLEMTKPFWAKKRGKTLLVDPDTGKEYYLTLPPSGCHDRSCLGGCRPGVGPRLHGSVEEAFYCNKLSKFLEVGEIASYQAQVAFELRDNRGRRVGTHYVDFLIECIDGTKEAREYKGLETDAWRLKAALFTWCYPDIRYAVVKREELI